MPSIARRVKVLNRRLEYLKKRQATKPGFGNAEITALTWALSILDPSPQENDGVVYQVSPDWREVLVCEELEPE